MATPILGDPLSSVLTMSTPVKTCPPHISSVSTCQSAGGAGHERDSTGAPPPAAPWSERESVLKGDIPALPVTVYFGYAATPVSADSERNISPAITCQSQDTAGLERNSMAARTPTTVAPQSSGSERNISPVITCQSEDGAELELDSTITRTPTTDAPQSSASEGHTSLTIT